MQNAQVEFIVFDAQDVIASSGNKGYYLRAQSIWMGGFISGTSYQENDIDSLPKDYSALDPYLVVDAKFTLVDKSGLVPDTYYKITGVEPGWMDSLFSFTYAEAGNFDPADNLYEAGKTTVLEVLDWLLAQQ